VTLNDTAIRFDDGARYEVAMGAWSRLAGDIFLDWLRLRSGLRWLDIGCGNGAFTQLLIERMGPVEVHGIDPSEGQLAYARARPAMRAAVFQRGDAMALPYADHRFDVAVMALVIVFVSDPLKGIEEMVRVVLPGGTVAAYVWDMDGGGSPLELILGELRAMGCQPPRPPQQAASHEEVLRDLWTRTGLEAVETRTIKVHRTFVSFEEFWRINLMASTVGPVVAALGSADAATLKSRVKRHLSACSGTLTCSASANAIRGRVRL
jgi:ubiquinone/menaquinone biosynthesis C-methylase UbiE